MTTPTRYVRGPDGRLVAVPSPIPPPEAVPIEEEEKKEEGDGISDLFEAPKKEDMSDLMDTTDETEVTDEDVMGEGEPEAGLTEEDEEYLFGIKEEDVVEEPPKPQKPKLRRTIKRYPPPPTTLGGMR